MQSLPRRSLFRFARSATGLDPFVNFGKLEAQQPPHPMGRKGFPLDPAVNGVACDAKMASDLTDTYPPFYWHCRFVLAGLRNEKKVGNSLGKLVAFRNVR
jgi:hypothetical protein